MAGAPASAARRRPARFRCRVGGRARGVAGAGGVGEGAAAAAAGEDAGSGDDAGSGEDARSGDDAAAPPTERIPSAPPTLRNPRAGPVSAGISQNQSTEPWTSQTTSAMSAAPTTA